MKKLPLFYMLIVLAGCGEVSVEDNSNSINSNAQAYRVECDSDGYYHLLDDNNNIKSESMCAQGGQNVCGDGIVITECDGSSVVFKCNDSALLSGIESITCTEGTCEHGACVNAASPECEVGINCDGECVEGVCIQACKEGVNCDGKCVDGVCKHECMEDVNCDGKCVDGVCKQECIEGVNCDGKCVDGVCKQECIEGVNCDDKCVDSVCKHECKEGISCDGKCVDGVCKPFDVLGCGDLGEGSFRVCSLEDLQDYRTLENRSAIHNLIIHGMIMCDDTCENIPAENLSSIVGEDAIITSYVPLTHPLFKNLKRGIVISNLTLNTDLYLKNPTSENDSGARGILANEATNVTVKELTVRGVELGASDKLNDAGVLFGHVNGGTFENIEMSDVHISMAEPEGYYQCSNSQFSSNIGGMIGVADGVVTITHPHVSDMTISARGAARVGGLIGYAHGQITIIGKYTGSVNDEFDISDVTVQYAERDAGGLIGRFGKDKDEALSVKMNNIKAKDVTVQSNNQCAGGLIGAGFQGELSIQDSAIQIRNVQSSGYAGGVLGKMHSLNDLSLFNLDIVSNDISSIEMNVCQMFSECSSGGCGELSGSFVGGAIGAVDGGSVESSVSIKQVRNVFKRVNSVNQYSGGLMGYANSISLTVIDVYNASTKDDSMIFSKEYVGGLFGALIGLKKLQLNNIINEIGKISGAFVAGISYELDMLNINNIFEISYVVSNVVEYGDDLAGFIGDLKLKSNNRFRINNILSKSLLEKNNYGGLINKLYLLNDKSDDVGLCNWDGTKCLASDLLKVSNVLVDNEVFDGIGSHYGGVMRYRYKYEDEDNLCSGTRKDTYNKDDDKKRFIRGVFSNVFYYTPGFHRDDLWETSLRALIWCGNSKDGDDENCRKAKKNDGNQCVLHRKYIIPIADCWFTDYIYDPNFKYDDESVKNTVESVDPNNIPLKPYIPFSVKLKDSDGIVLDGDKDYDKNNITAVKNSLDPTWKDSSAVAHKWTECTDNAIKSKLTMNYDRLLCPILTGAKYTCMKSGGCAE